ncbi:HYC_CC_PP family protein [Salinimicrobium sediminilitoris]|uniref:HYC_CC_PP family protein n=1 Tax=Salinimicrobium sediminilitoris TaxID=2876715 RepID=UPI0038CD876C
MKRLFQKSGSLIMAFLVLFSTVSFTVDKHFCGEILVDQAVFSEAKTCGMHGDITTSAEDECCDEEKVVVEGQKELKISFDDLDLDKQVFLSSFTWSYANLFEGEPQAETPFFHYKPPLLVYDIQLLDETFLI